MILIISEYPSVWVKVEIPPLLKIVVIVAPTLIATKALCGGTNEAIVN